MWTFSQATFIKSYQIFYLKSMNANRSFLSINVALTSTLKYTFASEYEPTEYNIVSTLACLKKLPNHLLNVWIRRRLLIVYTMLSRSLSFYPPFLCRYNTVTAMCSCKLSKCSADTNNTKQHFSSRVWDEEAKGLNKALVILVFGSVIGKHSRLTNRNLVTIF